MSARALAQRRQLAAAAAGNSSGDEESEEETPISAPPRNAGFAALLGDDDDDDDAGDDSDDDGEEEEKSEEAIEASPPPPPPAEEPAAVGQPALSKKAAKKARKKANAAVAAAAESESVPDGVDEELELLAESAAVNERSRREVAIASAWLVEPSTLDADKEMARRFGARAVRAAQREVAAEQRQQQGRMHGLRGHGRAAPTPRRVLLVVPKAAWGRPHGLIRMQGPMGTGGGGGGSASGGSGSGGGEEAPQLYGFEWSPEYERLHDQYEALVAASADPNLLIEMLRHEPVRADALLPRRGGLALRRSSRHGTLARLVSSHAPAARC